MLAQIVTRIIRMPQFKGKRRLLRILFDLADGQVVESKYGVKMRVHAKDYTNWACITGMYGRDYDDVYEVVCNIDAGTAFIDIGANAGLFSMVAARRVGVDGVVVAFEPNDVVYAQLLDNAAINGVQNFHPFEAAVGEHSGVSFFSAGGGTHTGVGRLSEQGERSVRVISFQDSQEILELIGGREACIKIDVEGAEALVVAGLASFLKSGQVAKVVVEIVHENLSKFSSNARDIYEVMRESGLSWTRGLDSAKHFNEVFVR